MPTLQFNDGVTFTNLHSDERRIESRHDGFYLVGRGVVEPIASREEGEAILAKAAQAAIRRFHNRRQTCSWCGNEAELVDGSMCAACEIHFNPRQA